MQSHHTIVTDVSSFSWFDVAVLGWLIVGFFRGRKNGMSVELLLMLQWVAIVVASALLYKPLGVIVAQTGNLTAEWAYRISYSLVALIVGGIMVRFKTMAGEKLVSADLFGKGEYILGMISGVIRFACITIVFLALLGAHVPTAKEIAAVNTKTKDLGEVSVNPLKIQHDIVINSCTGRLSREYLKLALIIPTPIKSAPAPAEDTVAKRREKALDDVMNPSSVSITPSK